ncbi:MAG: extracellular solute-binding protein [Betaproteobacteria bacterium]|nr:extracellular solute-binding protein [Betaproteobacteria bacterium]
MKRTARSAAAMLRQGAAVAGMLLAGAGTAWAQDDAFAADLYRKARAAKETKVAFYTSMVPAQFNAIQAAWNKRYPDIQIELVRADLGQTLERVLAESRARKYLADVISSNETSVVALQQHKLLAQFDVPTRDKWIEPFKSGFNGIQFPSRVLQIGFAVNTNKLKEAEYPRTWKDLLDPKWKNRLGIPDPRVGGGAQLWFLTLWDQKGYGEPFFKGLAANNPLIKPGIIQVQQSVELGEIDVDVVAYDYVTLPARNSGKPVQFVLPSDGTILFATYDSVAANAPNPNVARLFVHFLMSREGQETLAQAYVTPVHSEATPSPKASQLKGTPVLSSAPTEAQVKNIKDYVGHMNRVLGLR